MTTRQPLTTRRSSESLDFEVGGLRYTCTFSQYPDGRVSEVFLNNHKADSAADANARDSAIVASLALQHGGQSKRSEPPCSVTHAAMPAHRWTLRSTSSPPHQQESP
jgi:hypothetical protein